MDIERANYHMLVNLEPNFTTESQIDSEFLLKQITDHQLPDIVKQEQQVHK